MPLRAGGGRTPNGKCHLKFPFWFFESVPYLLFKHTLSEPQLSRNHASYVLYRSIHPLIKPLPAHSCNIKTSYTHAHQTVARLFPSFPQQEYHYQQLRWYLQQPEPHYLSVQCISKWQIEWVTMEDNHSGPIEIVVVKSTFYMQLFEGKKHVMKSIRLNWLKENETIVVAKSTFEHEKALTCQRKSCEIL